MTDNPQRCPYYVRMGRQIIACTGIFPGSELHQGFSEPGATKEHYKGFCCCVYHSCSTARMLNEELHKFEVHICPNNSGVDCLHPDECSRCGWNPEVAEKRLTQYINQSR